MIDIYCSYKPAKKIEIYLNNKSNDYMTIKINKIGVFGSGQVDET